MTAPLVLDAEAVRRRCPPEVAVAAIEQALVDGLDPAVDPPRVAVPVDAGQLLLMPSRAGRHHVGVKVVGVAPANPGVGLPRIQATYLLLDAATLALTAVLDGAALTTLRTPAVSVAAVRRLLLRRDGPLRVVVVGAGPQAVAHAEAFEVVVGPSRPCTSHFLVREEARARPGLPARAQVSVLGSADAAGLLGAADVVVCATSAREPVVDGDLLADHAVVVAVGSHEPDAREVDAALCRRATVVVEDRATALREAGDVVLAVAEGALDPSELVAMADLVTGRWEPHGDRPLLFKSVGMAWEDLVVASAVVAAG